MRRAQKVSYVNFMYDTSVPMMIEELNMYAEDLKLD